MCATNLSSKRKNFYISFLTTSWSTFHFTFHFCIFCAFTRIPPLILQHVMIALLLDKEKNPSIFRKFRCLNQKCRRMSNRSRRKDICKATQVKERELCMVTLNGVFEKELKRRRLHLLDRVWRMQTGKDSRQHTMLNERLVELQEKKSPAIFLLQLRKLCILYLFKVISFASKINLLNKHSLPLRRTCIFY